MSTPIIDPHLVATRAELVEYATWVGLPLEFADHQTESVLRHFAEIEGERFAEWLAERCRMAERVGP